jgi:hypothetical protein
MRNATLVIARALVPVHNRIDDIGVFCPGPREIWNSCHNDAEQRKIAETRIRNWITVS